MQRIFMGLAGVGVSLLLAGGSHAASSINVGSASGEPGATVTVEVSLSVGEGDEVAGTQNDISFGGGVAVVRRANGRPDCTVNGDIDKSASSFGFRPPGCTAETCDSIRALVLSTDNTDAIPDGSVLYTCKVAIAADATPGDKTLALSGVVLSDPAGNTVAAVAGSSGTITVEGEVTEPTPTPTAEPAPACEPVRPAPAGPAVFVEDQNLTSAGDAVISVLIATGGASVAGTQNDISFGDGVVIKRRANGRPDCAVNGDIDKSATSFGFRPPGCTAETCDSVRALVLSTDNTDAIPDGSVLYTCNVSVTGNGGTLPVSGVVLSDPAGNTVPGAAGRDGVICVEAEVEPTPTATTEPEPTDTPVVVPTDTPVIVPTDTPVVPTNTPVATRTSTSAPTATATPRPIAQGVLGTSIAADAGAGTTIEVGSVEGTFPARSIVRINEEQLEVRTTTGPVATTAGATVFLEIVKRAVSGSVAAAHPAGSTVEVVKALSSGGGGCHVVDSSASAGWLGLLPLALLLSARRRRS